MLEPVSGRTFDLLVVRNTNEVERNYNGISSQLSYRLRSDLQVGANYTLAWARGSVEGETATDGPVRASANDMPEYRQARWNFPVGYTNGDQRHKVRAWFSYMLPVPSRGRPVRRRADAAVRFGEQLRLVGVDRLAAVRDQPGVHHAGLEPDLLLQRAGRVQSRRHLADRPLARLGVEAAAACRRRGCSSGAW